MSEPFTFTLDIEDHRPTAETEQRLPRTTRAVLEWANARNASGTVFIVGAIAEEHPDLVRDVVSAGHEVGLHAWEHVPLTTRQPAQFEEETKRGKALLEDLSGQEVVGFRAPTFSLVRSTQWVTGILADLGFTYSSSVLPARSPLFGFPGLPREPFTWASGLVELPAPILRVGPLGLPWIGGAYLRALPGPVIRWARRHMSPDAIPFTYCHPYDFDTGEPYWVVPGTGRVLSRVLWIGRHRMFDRVADLLGDTPGPPLRDRLGAAAPVGAHRIPAAEPAEEDR